MQYGASQIQAAYRRLCVTLGYPTRLDKHDHQQGWHLPQCTSEDPAFLTLPGSGEGRRSNVTTDMVGAGACVPYGNATACANGVTAAVGAPFAAPGGSNRTCVPGKEVRQAEAEA